MSPALYSHTNVTQNRILTVPCYRRAKRRVRQSRQPMHSGPKQFALHDLWQAATVGNPDPVCVSNTKQIKYKDTTLHTPLSNVNCSLMHTDAALHSCAFELAKASPTHRGHLMVVCDGCRCSSCKGYIYTELCPMGQAQPALHAAAAAGHNDGCCTAVAETWCRLLPM